MTVRFVAETGSTNADLLAAAAHWREGDWLRAGRQTAGRGRLGRDWASPPGNLYASTLVRLHPGDPPAPTLALVAGVALHEAIAALAGAAAERVRLKWPNDLLADGAKLVGILLERAGDAVVIGVGVNLAEAPRGLGRAVAAVTDLGVAAPDPAGFAEELARGFARWLGTWRGQGLDAIRRAWLARAHPPGTALATTRDGEALHGLFDGLEPDGALRLRLADGAVTIVTAGDVSLL